MKWISVKDEMPQVDLDYVLVVGSSKINKAVEYKNAIAMACYGDGEFFDVEFGVKIPIATHWMMLPDLPDELKAMEENT